MHPFAIVGIGLALWLVFLYWHPSPDSMGSWTRGYVLLLIGTLLATAAVAWLLRRLHMVQYANFYALLFIVFGCCTAIAAATKARWYREVARFTPFWFNKSERTRQLGLTAAGVALVAYGMYLDNRSSHAYDLCERMYRRAATGAESTLVALEIPDSSFRPPRGRFQSKESRPFRCSDLD